MRPDSVSAAWQHPPQRLMSRFEIEPKGQAKWWASALARQCQGALDDLMFLAPWTSLSPPKNPASEISGLDKIPTLRELAGFEAKMLPAIERRLSEGADPEENAWLGELRTSVIEASRRAQARIAAIEGLALRSSQTLPNGI